MVISVDPLHSLHVAVLSTVAAEIPTRTHPYACEASEKRSHVILQIFSLANILAKVIVGVARLRTLPAQ